MNSWLDLWNKKNTVKLYRTCVLGCTVIFAHVVSDVGFDCRSGFILVQPTNQKILLQCSVTAFEMTILWGFTPNSFTPNRCWQLNYNLKPHHRCEIDTSGDRSRQLWVTDRSSLFFRPHQRAAMYIVLLHKHTVYLRCITQRDCVSK